MIAMGHYAHTAHGKPYPCWGYGLARAPGTCDGSIDYGYTVVLDRLQTHNISAPYPVGPLSMSITGQASIPEGVVDSNFAHDPLGFWRMTAGRKVLRFVAGQPQMAAKDGRWINTWGYICEDELEGCCTKYHIPLVRAQRSCTCETVCCQTCVETSSQSS